MRTEWQTVKVSDVCEFVVDCVNKTAPLSASITPYKMIRTSHIKNGFIRLTDEKCVSEETYQKWTRRASLEYGDVLLTREAPLGSVAMIREEKNHFLGQRIVQYRSNPGVLDPSYLLYTFLSPALQAQFKSYGGTGSTVDHIRVPDCLEFEIPLPPLEDQKAIAHILGTLDDKIELNRKTNETLEGIAKALFKSWFVDFDPVKAKAEGRPTGLPDEISKLFPDSFKESELGEIPFGWKFKPLGALTSWSSGSTPSKKNPDYWGGSVPWISANSMKDIFAINSDLKLTVQGVASGAKLARAGSILLLVRGSGLHSRISMCLAASEVSFNQDVKAIEASNEFGISAFQVFAYLSAISDQLLEMVEFTGIGAGKLDTDTLLSLPFAVPGECLTRVIEEVLAPIYEKIKANLWMENSLQHLRDALLPRLISGELKVSDVETMLEGVGI